MPFHPYYNALASQGIDHSLAMLTLLAHRPLMQTSYPTKKAKGSCSSQVNAIGGIVVRKKSKNKKQKPIVFIFIVFLLLQILFQVKTDFISG